MKLTTVFFLFIGLCISSAQAAATRSELYFQPKAATNSLQLGLLGQLNLRYGEDFKLSPANAKNSSSTNDGNRYGGGMSLTPYAALETGDANLHYGLALNYAFHGTRKTASASAPTTSETTGGDNYSLGPYFEIMAGPGMLYGVNARYTF